MFNFLWKLLGFSKEKKIIMVYRKFPVNIVDLISRSYSKMEIRLYYIHKDEKTFSCLGTLYADCYCSHYNFERIDGYFENEKSFDSLTAVYEIKKNLYNSALKLSNRLSKEGFKVSIGSNYDV